MSSLLCWPVLVPQITGGLVVPGLDTENVSGMKIQRWAITWALGCVNLASWLHLAAGREFTQPRAQLCRN